MARLPLFQKDGDYLAFERILIKALEKHPLRLLGYCLMPNHWHMVLWPEREGELTGFLRWLTQSMRWRTLYHTGGADSDDLLYAVLRYTERNALRAKLVGKAEDWRWGSLWHGKKAVKGLSSTTASLAVDLPLNWVDLVNAVQTEEEPEACAVR